MFRIGSALRSMAVLLTLVLAGCSVFMAASGEKDPHMYSIQRGSPRYVVEREFGAPRSDVLDEKGNSVCTYVFEVGDEPSGGRAAMHATLDVLTLGIWEIAGTPMEALQGETYQATVTYGPDDTVQTFRLSERPSGAGATTREIRGPSYPD